MKVVATVEARMNSSRLPGKVLLPAGPRTMVEHLLRRLRSVPSIDEVILATTVNAVDDRLAAIAAKEVTVFRGSENDVMARVIGAAESAHADVIVKITGDCPLIDPTIIENSVQEFKRGDCDYLCNTLERCYPDGMDHAIFTLETLKRSAAMTQEPKDREHITRHIRSHPELFRLRHLSPSDELYWPELGLTLDERSDYELLHKLIAHFGESNPLFTCLEIVRFLREHTDWVAINQAVERKGYSKSDLHKPG